MNTATKKLVSAFWGITMGTAVLIAQPVSSPSPAASDSTNAIGPRIRFQTLVYDFGEIMAGRIIKYTYVFTNVGDQVLEVTEVEPSCSCSVADDWTRLVEPGQTGVIPVQFNSAGLRGAVDKSFTIISNDKRRPEAEIKLTGIVGGKPFDVNPAAVFFSILPGATSNATAVVFITNNIKQPLILSTPESDSPSFAALLKTNEPGRSFVLHISTVPPLSAGGIRGKIVLKTSVADVPTITIPAIANVKQPITVLPNQIVLPSAPLPAKVTNTVLIQYIGPDVLALSNPSVNAKGVEVHVKEQQPGHIFFVTLIFPKGFKIASDVPVEFTVNSSHPKYPVLRAGIHQTPSSQ
jgi:hypothetical protein